MILVVFLWYDLIIDGSIYEILSSMINKYLRAYSLKKIDASSLTVINTSSINNYNIAESIIKSINIYHRSSWKLILFYHWLQPI